MGYSEAIEANGVKIKEFKEFGSYQGDWFALLEDGRIVFGSYGSCSGCDAFQSEFDYECEIIVKQVDGFYYKGNYSWNEDEKITEQEVNELNLRVSDKLKAFGKSYLDDAQTLDEIISRYKRKIDNEENWGDDEDIYKWLLTLKTP